MPSPSLAELQKQVEVLQEQIRNASSKAETFQEPARKKKEKGSAIGKENGTEEAEEDASGIDRVRRKCMSGVCPRVLSN